MRRLRARLGIFVWTVAPLPCLLAHCGSDTPTPPQSNTDAGDATAQDASYDVTLPDASSEVATGDETADRNAIDAERDAGEASGDALDSGGDATSDGSDENVPDGDQSDGDAEAAVQPTPCIDAGDGAPSCNGTLTCCGASCIDTTTDPLNCGACGHACTSTQFCTGLACDDAIFKNVCDNRKATAVLDPYAPDNDAGIDIATALSTGCTPVGVTFVVADQEAGTAQDLASGRPIAGPGNTLVAGGGAFGQGSVKYMDGHALTTIVLGTNGTTAWYRNSKTTMDVVSFPNASLTMHHDYFLLELSVEPVSGTLCFFGIGAEAPGTTAAAYFFRTSVLPQRSTFTDAWYIYEWTDTNADGLPSAGDTFALVAQGM